MPLLPQAIQDLAQEIDKTIMKAAPTLLVAEDALHQHHLPILHLVQVVAGAYQQIHIEQGVVVVTLVVPRLAETVATHHLAEILAATTLHLVAVHLLVEVLVAIPHLAAAHQAEVAEAAVRLAPLPDVEGKLYI